MQKNNILLILIASIALILPQGCEKTNESILSNENSQIKNELFDNEVKKELVLKDESGENSVFITIYSDNINNLETFLNSHELKLVTTISEYSKEVFKSNNLEQDNSKKSLTNYDLEAKPKIYIEVVYTNFKKDVS